MEKITQTFKSMIQFLIRDHGQDLIEYALLVAMISLGAVASMKTVAGDIVTAYTGIGTTLTSKT